MYSNVFIYYLLDLFLVSKINLSDFLNPNLLIWELITRDPKK